MTITILQPGQRQKTIPAKYGFKFLLPSENRKLPFWGEIKQRTAKITPGRVNNPKIAKYYGENTMTEKVGQVTITAPYY